MAYSSNPYLPRVRMQAVNLVRQGWSKRKVARYVGVTHSAVVKWTQKAEWHNGRTIPTKSSRPRNHPRALPQAMIVAIIAQRRKRNRCAEVVHQELRNQDISVSLSSVKRTLKRNGLLRERSPWKRWHVSEPRPFAQNAGDLVQIDTIHIVLPDGQRFYIYTMLDVASRWAYAKISLRINTHRSIRFVQEAQRYAPFQFRMLQSDHGPEFSTTFTERNGIAHRHSRVRKPNDNAHLERFNRTIQEECLYAIPRVPAVYQKAIKEYLPYYNGQRLHLGINLQTPLQMVPSY